MVPKFVKVMPKDYKRMLQAIKTRQRSGLSGEEAIMAAFEENAKDVCRVSVAVRSNQQQTSQSVTNQRHMGKPTGFIEYLRELPLDRSATERIRDWNEFHLHLDEEKLQRARRALHGLRHSLLSHRHAAERDGLGLPDSTI